MDASNLATLASVKASAAGEKRMQEKGSAVLLLKIK